jgi:hypothetical protein
VSTDSDDRATGNEDTRQHNNGWIGLIGLIGLAGLRVRRAKMGAGSRRPASMLRRSKRLNGSTQTANYRALNRLLDSNQANTGCFLRRSRHMLSSANWPSCLSDSVLSILDHLLLTADSLLQFASGFYTERKKDWYARAQTCPDPVCCCASRRP